MGAKRISGQERIAMKHAFFQGNTLVQVAKDFKRSLPGVKKYALREGWEEERESFLLAYEKKTEARLLDKMAKDIGDLDEMQSVIMKEFREDVGKEGGTSRVNPADRVDKVVRLVEAKARILGIGRRVGSLQPGGQGSVSSSRTVVLQGLPSEQLEAMRRKLLADLDLPAAKAEPSPPQGGA